MHKPIRSYPGSSYWILVVFVPAVMVLAAQPASASDETLAKQLTAAKLLPKGTSHKFLRNGAQLIVELSHYPAADERTQKIDSLLIARTIMHAEPASADSVITRFLKDNEAGSYTDVMISNRQVVGADAGIMGSAELLSEVEAIPIAASDSPEVRYAKYCAAAGRAQDHKDCREAEHMYAQAFKESPEAARKDSKYFEGMVKLAKSYADRFDTEYEEHIYKCLLDALPTAPAFDSLVAMRHMYAHFAGKENWTAAEAVAKQLVDLEKASGAPQSAQLASDLQLLGASRRKQGNLKDARSDYEEALGIKTKIFGADNAALADALEGLGDCYADEKESGKAYEYYNKSKILYDQAVAARNSKDRISYDTYRTIMVRLKEKMGKKVGP